MKGKRGISLIVLIIIIVLILIIGAVTTVILIKNNKKNLYEVQIEETIGKSDKNNEVNRLQENALKTNVYTTYMETLKKSDIITGNKDSNQINYACCVVQLPPIMFPTKITLIEDGNKVNNDKVLFETYEQYNDNYYIICYIAFPADKSLSDYKLYFESSNTGDSFEKLLNNNIAKIPENMDKLYDINGTTYWFAGKEPTGGTTGDKDICTVSYLYKFYPLNGNGFDFNSNLFSTKWTEDTKQDIRDNYKLEYKTIEHSIFKWPVYDVRLYYNPRTIESIYGNNKPNEYTLLKKQVVVTYNNEKL